MANVLMELPVELLKESIVTNYLDLKSIAIFDVAVSDKTIRCQFRNISIWITEFQFSPDLPSMNRLFPTLRLVHNNRQVHIDCTQVVNWLIGRNIKILKYCIHSNLSLKSLLSLVVPHDLAMGKHIVIKIGPRATAAQFRTIARECTDIESLDVTPCAPRVRDTWLRPVLKNCYQLKALFLDYCNTITDVNLVLIAENCPLIEELRMSHCFEISDYGVQRLAESSSLLKILDVSYCELIGDDGLISLTQCCKSLTTLLICSIGCQPSTCTLVTALPNITALDFGNLDLKLHQLQSIVAEFPDLKLLSLRWCDRLSDTALLCIAKSCPHLEQLNLGYCRDISDVGLLELAKGCMHLTSLNICSTAATKRSLAVILANKKLKVLDISQIGFTKAELLSGMYLCKDLESLRMDSCAGLTDHVLRAISENCTMLKILRISYCNRISNTGLMQLIKLPRLDTLHAVDCACLTALGVERFLIAIGRDIDIFV